MMEKIWKLDKNSVHSADCNISSTRFVWVSKRYEYQYIKKITASWVFARFSKCLHQNPSKW